MMTGKPQFLIHLHPFRRQVEIRFGVQSVFGDHKWAVARPAILETVEEGTVEQPMLEVPLEAAQGLMDELWRVGLRPTEGSGSAGSLAATERHLADMRALVFKTGKS